MGLTSDKFSSFPVAEASEQGPLSSTKNPDLEYGSFDNSEAKHHDDRSIPALSSEPDTKTGNTLHPDTNNWLAHTRFFIGLLVNFDIVSIMEMLRRKKNTALMEFFEKKSRIGQFGFIGVAGFADLVMEYYQTKGTEKYDPGMLTLKLLYAITNSIAISLALTTRIPSSDVAAAFVSTIGAEAITVHGKNIYKSYQKIQTLKNENALQKEIEVETNEFYKHITSFILTTAGCVSVGAVMVAGIPEWAPLGIAAEAAKAIFSIAQKAGSYMQKPEKVSPDNRLPTMPHSKNSEDIPEIDENHISEEVLGAYREIQKQKISAVTAAKEQQTNPQVNQQINQYDRYSPL
jgi:hypothetical protein